jgi:energy-converting hydrogenase A subunit M
MARMAGIESLEQRIEKAQGDVVKAKQRYDLAVAKLKDLMDKRDVKKRDELVTMIMKSSRSYEEIHSFLKDDNNQAK